MMIYPNPVTGKEGVLYINNMSGLLTIELFDITGKLLYTTNVFSEGEILSNISFPFTNSDGIYECRVRSNRESREIKILISNGE